MHRRIVLSVFFSLFLFALFANPAFANNPVPLLSAPSPAAAAPGGAAFTLTVQGSNFVSGAVVNWNGSPRTTTFLSPTQVTAAIAAADIASQGTATITVTNPAPGGGVSNQIYFSIAPPSSRIAFSENLITRSAFITTSAFVEGDFNNDGKLDVAVANGSFVYVLLGTGDGNFQPAIATAGPADSSIHQLYVADVNNDGKLDLYALGTTSSNYSLLTFLGNGDGTFQPAVRTDFAAETNLGFPFAFADLNRDGVLDAIHVNQGQIVVAYGHSDGTFVPGSVTTVNVPYRPVGIAAVGDLRGQGDLSLVIYLVDPADPRGGSFLGVFDTTAGIPSGTPATYPQIGSAFGQGESVALGDFNGDGKLDMAVSISTADLLGGLGPGELEILLNSSSTTQSSFGPALFIPDAEKTYGGIALLADFNGDGVPDIAADGLIFFGKGDGTFPTSTGSPRIPFNLAGDFNGDGKPDLLEGGAIVGGTAPDFAVFLQIPAAPDFSGSVSPSVATLTPASPANFRVNFQALSGFSSDVTVSASGLPAGVTYTATPAVVTGGNGSSTIAFSVNGSVVFGAYTITLTGTGGGITHSSQVTLVVNPSVGDFSGSVTPDTENITSGHSATYTVTITPNGGFTGSVALTLSGALPSGSTFSFNPSTITGGSGTSTLTINTPAGLAANVYNFTITATSGTISRSHTVSLGVSPSAGDFSGTYSTSLTSPPNGLVEYVFFLTPINGYTQPVTISMSGFPAGAVNDGPINVTPGGAGGGIHVTLTNVAPGTYPILITFQGPGVIHKATASLVVTP